jgi:dienelactone hydrolase
MNQTKYAGLIRIGLLQALFVAVAALGPARAEGIRFEPLQIPAVIAGSTFRLEAIVVRPDEAQPHPLALINHGSPRDPADRPKMSPYGMWPQAAAFARRGWTAVAFMRRGYGHSQGAWTRPDGSCANRDYVGAGLAEASDIAAAAKFMSGQAYVSKGKWISVGVSAGGFATVALASNAPSDLAAAMVFAPGRGSSAPDTVCSESSLVAAFAQYGKTSRVPLWVSAENDHFFGPQLTAKFTAAFARGGGQPPFVGMPAFGDDGHTLFSARGLAIWSPVVDKFLASNSLALRDRLIDLPTPDVPPPSSLNARGRETFKTYLDSGPNKAFATGGGTHFGWATGRRTADDAIRDALGFCTPDPGAKCTIVNVNNKPAE